MPYSGTKEEVLIKKRTADKKWRHKNPEKVRAKAKKWRDNNPQKSKAVRRKYRLANLQKARARARIWHHKNPEKSRASHLRSHFNISLEDWKKIFEFQKGLCGGCGRPNSDFKKRFAVDHDHSTRVIRGLLCYNCNKLLPNRKNLVNLLKSLIVYLESPPAVFALGKEHLANPLRRKRKK